MHWLTTYYSKQTGINEIQNMKFITELQSVETRVITKYSCILVSIQAFSTVQSSSKQSATCTAFVQVYLFLI